MVLVRNLARAGWTGRRLLGAAVVLALGAWLVRQAWVELAQIAVTAAGLVYLPLVPVVIVTLVWVRRRRARACQPQGHVAAPLVVIAGWLLYELGTRGLGSAASASLALHAGAWTVMVGCLLAVCRQAVLGFLPAVGALAFFVPAPLVVHQGLPVPVHAAAVELSWTVCYMLGVSGAAGADQVSRAVGEAVGGLPLLLALCLVSYAFAFSRPWPWSVRAVVLALSPAAAVLCGIAALVVTAWVLGRFTPGVDALLLVSRWAMLAVALAALAGLLRLVAWASVPLRFYPRASLEQ